MSTTLTILMGGLFVILGRWLFAHPDKFAPSWFGSTVVLNDLGRFMGISMTFVGTCAALFAISAPFLPGVLDVPLVLASSFALTWVCFRGFRAKKRDLR